MRLATLFRRFHREATPGREVVLPVRYLSTDPAHAGYSMVSADPPIFVVAHWMDEELRFSSSMEQIYTFLAERRAYFLLVWHWHIDKPERVAWVLRYEQQHRRAFPGHRFIHLCNTVSQHDVFAAAGLEAVLCSHNALVDERIYHPLPATPKRFDAVYDARLKAYKRHELASALDSLALIYANTPGIDNPAAAAKILSGLTQAYSFNQDAAGAYVQLTDSEVNGCLNQCRVGLCLSAVEGANYASIQYLLSGLPVVSTASKGGRDLFFDDICARIVDDTPGAVAAGVETMLQRCPPADLVRQRTLDKVRVHRQRFIDTVQGIYKLEGVDRSFAAEWESVFFNRMVRWQRHEATIESLRRVGMTLADVRATM